MTRLTYKILLFLNKILIEDELIVRGISNY